MDAAEQKVLKDIEQYGCHVLKIFDEKSEQPNFAYSVGIFTKFKRPELMVIGLNLDSAHELINEYCARTKRGEFLEAGKFYSDFLANDYKVFFAEVSEKYFPEYFGWNQWYYEGPKYKVLQMIFPTKDNEWPWSTPTPELFRWLPILTESGTLSEPS